MIYIIVSIVAIVVISLVIISWQHDNPMKKSQKLDKENLQSHWKEIIGKAKDRPPRETMLAATSFSGKAVELEMIVLQNYLNVCAVLNQSVNPKK
jgi:hypothetical protein